MFRRQGAVTPCSVLRPVEEPLTCVAMCQLDGCASYVHPVELEKIYNSLSCTAFGWRRGRSRALIYRTMIVVVVLISKLSPRTVAHGNAIKCLLVHGARLPVLSPHLSLSSHGVPGAR